jgi:hypothetical protein
MGLFRTKVYTLNGSELNADQYIAALEDELISAGLGARDNGEESDDEGFDDATPHEDHNDGGFSSASSDEIEPLVAYEYDVPQEGFLRRLFGR